MHLIWAKCTTFYLASTDAKILILRLMKFYVASLVIFKPRGTSLIQNFLLLL